MRHGGVSDYHFDDEILGKAYDARLAKRLLKYARPYTALIILNIVLALFVTLFSLAGPWLIGLAIDKGILPGNKQVLLIIAFVYLSIEIIQLTLSYLSEYLLQYLGQKIMYGFRLEVFQHLQSLSIRFFDRNPVGRLVTRVTNDIAALSELFSVGMVTVFRDIFSIIGLLTVLFLLNSTLTLLVIAVLPVLVVITFYYKGLMRNTYREVRKRLARLNAFIQEMISGIRVIQIFHRPERTAGKFAVINTGHYRSSYQAIRYLAQFVPTVTIIGAVPVGLILYYGGGAVAHKTMELGVLVAMIQYVRHIFEPIRDLADKYTIFQSAFASAERIFKVLDTPPEITDLSCPQPIESIKGGIEFANVWFDYEARPLQDKLRPDVRRTPSRCLRIRGVPIHIGAYESSDSIGEHRDEGDPLGDNFVLKDVSFKINPGESVAVVGMTGAGKSTIINLLARLYDVSRGAVRIDGIDIREFAQRDLRRQMAIVLQDVFLFSGNIIDNIRLGEEQVTLEKIREIARVVQADDFIEQIPGSYLGKVEERGATLSAGQRQLIAFARALAFNPRILILDEATSSVDVETEQAIQTAIRKLVTGRTSIIIAHRLSTIQMVNRIIVIHKGEVREMGTHDELLARRGLYHQLYRLQYRLW